MKYTLIIIFILQGFFLYARTEYDPLKDVSIDYSIKQIREKEIEILFSFKTPDKLHIIKNALLQLTIPNTSGKIVDIIYPPSLEWKNSKIFKGNFTLKLIVILSTNIKRFPLEIQYQTCNEEQELCYFPTKKIITIDFNKTLRTTLQEKSFINRISDSLKKNFNFHHGKNIFIVFILIFFGGILTSLTPCVYPMIPLTIGYIGASSQGSRFKGFILSLFFVLGLSLVYSTLGVLAAATGSVFGSLTQTPWVTGFIALVFIVMAMSMFGLFDLQLPSSLVGKLQSKKQTGYIGAILVGMITGLIAAPCAGPVLISLLAWVAQTRNLVLGFWLLFIFTWGMGILFILLGTFAGFIKSMPRAGSWMKGIKYFFGLLMLFVGYYYLFTIIPLFYFYFILGISLLCFAIIMMIQKKNEKSIFNQILLSLLIITGVIFIILSLQKFHKISIFSFIPQPSVHDTTYPFQMINKDKEAFHKAKTENKLVFMDFYADWCIECKQMEKSTYPDKTIKEIFNNFITVKIDFTKQNNYITVMKKKYNILSLPTMIIFNSNQKEIKRLFGYYSAQELKKELEGIENESYHRIR